MGAVYGPVLLFARKLLFDQPLPPVGERVLHLPADPSSVRTGYARLEFWTASVYVQR